MRRGTKPTIDIHISGIEPADVVRAYVTLKQGATQKTYETIPDENGNISVYMTQEDTLQFAEGKVSIQIKIKMVGGNVVASRIYTKSMDDILNTEVI